MAPIGPLAWELPYAVGAALEKKKKRGREREIFKRIFSLTLFTYSNRDSTISTGFFMFILTFKVINSAF